MLISTERIILNIFFNTVFCNIGTHSDKYIKWLYLLVNLTESRLSKQFIATFWGLAGLSSGGQSTQIKYLSKSTDTYNKILLQ